MSVVVFWLESYETDSLAPCVVTDSQHKQFTDDEFMDAMKFAETLRKNGRQHVSISTQLSDCVTKPGVAAVENGKTPDGHDYEWCKKHRGNPTKE